MAFVIFNSKTNKYVKHPKNWTESFNKATKFETWEKVNNYLTNNFPSDYKGTPIEDVEAIDTDALLSTVYKDEVIPCAALLDEEAAQAELTKLHDLLALVSASAQNFASLPNYFSKQIKDCDMETLDVLHKIELANVNVVGGFRLYKQLQEIRRRRRNAKDAMEVCSLLLSTGLIKSFSEVKKGLAELEKETAERTYSPRIRKEMFTDTESAATT